MLSIKHFTLPALLYCFITSCNTNNAATLTAAQVSAVKHSATNLMNAIAKDISQEGPVAWLKYFEKSPSFFMASEGHIAFANNDAATAFVQNVLIKNIKQIQLQWRNMRIDALTPTLASVGADFNEELTSSLSTATVPVFVQGYFTAVAGQTPQGWQLRNLHWSIEPKQ